MKKRFLIVITILLLLGGCATNNIPQKQQQINTDAIVDNLNIKKFIDVISTVEPSKTDKNYDKKAASFKVFKIIAAKYFTYEQLKSDIGDHLSKNFTNEELRELSEYVQSDVSKKYRKVYPELIKEIMTFTKNLLTEKKDILAVMIQKRVLEIKNKQNLSNILMENQKKLTIKREQKNYSSSSKNKSQAEMLFENPMFEELYLSSIEVELNKQIKSKPIMLLYKDILEKFVEDYLSYKDAKPYFVKAFSKRFTEDELRIMNKFNLSDIGKKYTNYSPKLRKYVKTLFSKTLIEHIGEVASLLKAENAKANGRNYSQTNNEYINKKLYVAKNIPNLIVVKSTGDIKIKYKPGTNFTEHEKAVKKLKKYLKETPNLLSKELRSREVELVDLNKNEKSKYLLIIKPFEYEVKTDGYLKIRIILFDIENISKNWNSKVTSKEK
ncbi:MAG: hypothetical protein WBG69_01970, partial [Arcobacteraceae bacterium]